MGIGERILHLRKKMGISQEELADQIGVSRQAVSKWESGQSIPDIDKVIALSDFFNVTTDYILKGVESSSSSTTHVSKKYYSGFIITFALIAWLWAFRANQFRNDEIVCIMIAGGVIGFGIGRIVLFVMNMYANKN